jgi:hypothetical protein
MFLKVLLFLDEISRTLNTFLVSRIEEIRLLKLKPNMDNLENTKILHKECFIKLPLEVCFEINYEGYLRHRNSKKYHVRDRCECGHPCCIASAIVSIIK